MVTIVKNPTGHKIIDQLIEAGVYNSGGDALITKSYHGLGTGDYVYVVSDIDDYAGFWYVTAIDTDTFKLSEYAGGDYLPFYRDIIEGLYTEFSPEGGFAYYQTNQHEWNSIFLPIIYKATNDRWPINTVDTARTVSSFADDVGYTDLMLSGDLKSSFLALDYVKISGATDDDLNGVWQIVEKVSSSQIVIDLPYNAGNSFAGATVQFYYNNYQVKVKIFAGLENTHPWEDKKPFIEVAELSLTPDDNNIVMFSVSDYIQGKVAIKNNPTLFSMPLNLDAFTGFYVSTSETYDVSDGYSQYTSETDYTADSFVGYAVAGKLEFKNIYSGMYSKYVYTDGSPASWLTMMDRLLAVEGKFFDVSFIKNLIGTFTLIIDKYIADYRVSSQNVEFSDDGIGVYRIAIPVDANFDSYCIRVNIGEVQHTEEICIDILESCDAVGGFTPTDIRLLEDGSYRLLE